jgi:hypothetical protein
VAQLGPRFSPQFVLNLSYLRFRVIDIGKLHFSDNILSNHKHSKEDYYSKTMVPKQYVQIYLFLVIQKP